MTSIITKVFIALLFSTNFLFADLFKITLNSGDVYDNCKYLEIKNDSIYVSFLKIDSPNKTIHIENIKSIVKMSDSFVIKYDFTGLSRIQKIETIMEIIEPDVLQTTSPISPIPESYFDRDFKIILISFAVLILLGTGVALFIKLRKMKSTDEKVPGAKEMVKTLTFWAKRHRDDISKY